MSKELPEEREELHLAAVSNKDKIAKTPGYQKYWERKREEKDEEAR